ncbi:hypothetical protein SAMD00023378_4539 [Ralstonia sp. NT80]|nr:hypothetical protein SAMD00023378_4539 [Ralstonia sp. NT80]
MAIVPKDAVLQIRLPADLLERYRALCDESMTPVSAKLRQYILWEVERWEKGREREAVKRAYLPAPVPVVQEVPAPAPAAPRAVSGSLDEALGIAEKAYGRKLSRSEKREVERDWRKGRL